MKVMVMAGTSDAVNIINKLVELTDIEIIATTTTQHGKDLAIKAGANKVIADQMGIEEIEDLIHINKINILIDATHPFAVNASLNAIRSAKNTGIKYIRFERPSIEIPKNKYVLEVSTFQEAAKKAYQTFKQKDNCKIMHFAGVSTLHHIIQWISPKYIITRVLPVEYSLKKCLEMKIPNKNIIAMQGIFSKNFNKALLEEYKIGIAVTKESGKTGGTPTKIEAAIDLEIPIIIVKRPVINEIKNEITFNNIENILDYISNMKNI
ncbi:MAG: precorrin-6A reductase [Methanobacterium sp.]|nr:precorrin-6A reductase [Methanobacterium sp.]